VRDEISLLHDAKPEGLLEVEARLLTKQIKFRFGELPNWAIDNLAKADTTQLEQWGEQLIQANPVYQKRISLYFSIEIFSGNISPVMPTE